MTEAKTCGCGRPAVEGEEPTMCALHHADWDARATLEDLELAEKMVAQFDGILKEFACPPLTETMGGAKDSIKSRREEAERRLEEVWEGANA